MDYFNDIVIKRINEDSDEIKEIKVPISFGPMGKDYGFRKEAQFFQNKQVPIYYQNRPKIVFNFSSLALDEARAASLNEFRTTYNPDFKKVFGTEFDDSMIWKDLNPVPYTLGITMGILCEHMSDLTQILEIILPWFDPQVFLRVKEFEFLNVERNIPLKLNSVNFEITNELGQDENLKICNANLDLTAHIVMYRPFQTGRLVKIINTKFDIGETSSYGLNPQRKTEDFGLLGALRNLEIEPKPNINVFKTDKALVDNTILNDGTNLEIDRFAATNVFRTPSDTDVQNWDLNRFPLPTTQTYSGIS